MADRDDTPDLPQDAPLRVRVWWRFWRAWRAVVLGTAVILCGAWWSRPDLTAHRRAAWEVYRDGEIRKSVRAYYEATVGQRYRLGSEAAGQGDHGVEVPRPYGVGALIHAEAAVNRRTELLDYLLFTVSKRSCWREGQGYSVDALGMVWVCDG